MTHGETRQSSIFGADHISLVVSHCMHPGQQLYPLSVPDFAPSTFPACFAGRLVWMTCVSLVCCCAWPRYAMLRERIVAWVVSDLEYGFAEYTGISLEPIAF